MAFDPSLGNRTLNKSRYKLKYFRAQARQFPSEGLMSNRMRASFSIGKWGKGQLLMVSLDIFIPIYILWYMDLTKTTILIKTDKAIKESAQKTAERIGIPLSTILNAYLRQFVSEGRVEFSAYMPNTKTRKAIHNAQLRKNIEIYNP